MIRKPIPRWLYLTLAVGSAVVLLLLYTWMSYRQHQINPLDTTIPTWSQFWEGIKKVCTPDRSGDRWIVVDTLATLERLGIGMAISVAVSLIIGIAMGCFTWIEAMLKPPIATIAKVAPTAALPVFFVLVGTDNPMFISMIVFGVVPSLTMSIYLAVKDIPNDIINISYTLQASRFEIIFCVILPQILPKVIEAVKLQIGPAVVYLLAAEVMVAHEGFGYRIRLQGKILAMNVAYLYLALLAIIGLVISFLLGKLQHLLCRWHTERT